MQIEECLDRLLDKVTPTHKTEYVSIEDALGRIAAKTILSDLDVPSFPRSAMDGYAVHSEDLAGASKESPVLLTVSGEVLAGDVPEPKWDTGKATAVRIMTGAAVPEGYDAILKQEDTDYGMETVKVFAGIKPLQNLCATGEDLRKGSTLLTEGTRIHPGHIALLAETGMAGVEVYAPMRVAILSTGSELLNPGDAPACGKIFNTISFFLEASLKQKGVIVTERKVCADEEEVLTDAIAKALKEADLLITTGGVSVGKRDIVPAVVKAMGAEVLFQGADIQPGTPTLASVLNQKIILSLSGNPYAAIANFECYFWDVLAKFMHSDELIPLKTEAVLGSEYKKVNHHRRLLRASYKNGEVRLVDKVHASSVISNLTKCNCFIDLEAGRSVQVGDTVRVRLFGSL